MFFKLFLSVLIIFSKKSFPLLLLKCFFIRSGKKFNSSPPKTFGWLDSICSTSVVPDLGIQIINIGVVSKSGTLTYEAIDQLVNSGLGQTTAIGIGGDPIIGTTMRDCLELFQKDPETDGIVIIGEIGGQMELEAAYWAKENMSKPIAGFIAGKTAPPGKRMGHAGAIVSGGNDTAEAKIKVLTECGIFVSESVADIGSVMKSLMN